MDNKKLVFIPIFVVKTNSKKVFHKCNGEVTGEYFDCQIFDWNSSNDEKL